MSRQLLRFFAGPELGLVSTLLFAGLYTWPLLTSSRPSATFRFTFIVWCSHVALIAAAGAASRKLGTPSSNASADAERDEDRLPTSHV